MMLKEFMNKKIEIPLKVEVPLSDIGDFIKKQKESLISTIKTYRKNYINAENALKAHRSQPPVKPPDGTTRPRTPINYPSSATISGHSGTTTTGTFQPKQEIPEPPVIERYEIPLATKDDFVQIHPGYGVSGTTYYPGQQMPSQPSRIQNGKLHGSGIFIRGDSIGNGIFISSGKSDPALIDRANELLETTEDIKPQKLPDSRDIPDSITIQSSSPEFKEILEILYKNKRI